MLRELHRQLGIPEGYARSGGMPLFDEATELVDVGPNLLGRMQRLAPETAASWAAMVDSAAAEGVRLLIVSGYRSFDYQARLIRKKINAGQSVSDILRVNAAPGFSEHHSGRAVDIATPGSRPLSEEFEHSDAFRWLTSNAAGFGFSMTYPRDNPHGVIYEPWHWAQRD